MQIYAQWTLEIRSKQCVLGDKTLEKQRVICNSQLFETPLNFLFLSACGLLLYELDNLWRVDMWRMLPWAGGWTFLILAS